MNKYLVLIFVVICFVQCQNNIETKKQKLNPAKVRIVNNKGKYQLLVNGKPFYIKGAGLEFGSIKDLAKHKGNSFRTWRTENGQKTGQEVLEEAYKNGIMVTMVLELGRERLGFNYNDSIAVKKQFESIKKQVLALKNYPALIIWGIGNELNLRYANPKVWDAVNDISKMIHKVDSNHLTTTSLAGITKQEVNYIKKRCPDLDILSVQMYGDLPDLPHLIKEYGWKGPYMVTEWGATGHWEVPKTTWGSPIEENSTIKAANYLKRYKAGIQVDSLQCLGSYVFLWGNKQERTPTWYGMFLEDGKETESVDVMHYIWNNEWPKNRTPQIKKYTLNNKTAYQNIVLKPNHKSTAQVVIHDFENDKINYKWELLPESTFLKDGGDYEIKPKEITFKILANKGGEIEFKTPKKGLYRLYVYADDGLNHAATANIPFKVN
ncbi:MAG: hypothetical protein L3J45_06160 [Flavobacteriaceae bacterium]|nr:hypothetical protein [Flavobacteriaceae bacterium]